MCKNWEEVIIIMNIFNEDMFTIFKIVSSHIKVWHVFLLLFILSFNTYITVLNETKKRKKNEK